MADIRGIFKSVWRNLRATNAGILLVTGKTVNSKTTVALAATTDYAAEDVLSNSASAGLAWRFRNVVEREGGSGEIVNASVKWVTTALSPRITLYLYEAAPTSQLNDNAANTALLAADITNYIGKIEFMALSDLGGVSEASVSPSTVGGLPIMFVLESGRDIYGIAVLNDAVTGESAGANMTITLSVRQM
ncbi:hypothetical protein LCGC14_1833720 [marine sediment metagenome]|uniref:Uncharacterized protein n=1 Tax=marine sediment metagenome TaxID=412755 RepID=A0A0F9IUT4_9ZZZZ